MVTRSERVDTPIPASACVAVLTVFLLGWQIRRILERMNLLEATGHGADSWYQSLLLEEVTVCIVVSAFLWPLFLNTCRNNRAGTRLQLMAHRLSVLDDRKRLIATLSHSRSTLAPAKADFSRCEQNGNVRSVSTRSVPVRWSDRFVIWVRSLFDIAEFRTN